VFAVVFNQLPDIVKHALFDGGEIGKIIQRIQTAQFAEFHRILVVHPHHIRPVADDRRADQALALRRPVAKFQLDVDIRATGVKLRDGLLHPIAQTRHPAKLPQHDRCRFA